MTGVISIGLCHLQFPWLDHYGGTIGNSLVKIAQVGRIDPLTALGAGGRLRDWNWIWAGLFQQNGAIFCLSVLIRP
ncbi:hypothetical protein PJI16_18915 [Nitrospira sp. MA-1]|nr:hypothetical protein [Nitrospira sp. MA-1]